MELTHPRGMEGGGWWVRIQQWKLFCSRPTGLEGGREERPAASGSESEGDGETESDHGGLVTVMELNLYPAPLPLRGVSVGVVSLEMQRDKVSAIIMSDPGPPGRERMWSTQ